MSASRVELRISRQTPPPGEVATLSIDRRERLNALDSALMDELAGRLERLAGHADLRAVVLTGAGGRAFIGGADIPEMAALETGTAARAFIARVHRVCRCLRELPVPAIARIDGYALGAGLEVAAACDLRVASGPSRFGMPEVRVGLPSVVEAALLPRLIGWGRTRELLLFGRSISAATALEWGLVSRVVPADRLDAAVEDYLAALVETGPQAVRLQKALLRTWETEPLDRAIAAGLDCFAAAWDSDEPKRMLQAFAGRRRR